jgi:hypothetical protein
MKKKQKKKLNKKLTIKLIISIIMLILSLICFKYINDLDILPNKYLYLVLAMILVLNLLAIAFLFIKGIICKIFSIILYLILGFISILGIKYAGNTIKFLDKGFNNNIEYNVYNIIVPVESSYTNIKELNNTTMGYFFIDVDNDEYLDKVKKKVNVTLKQLGLGELYEGILNNEIDSIIINEGYINLLESEYPNFSEKTKILDTVKIEKKEEPITEIISLGNAFTLLSNRIGENSTYKILSAELGYRLTERYGDGYNYGEGTPIWRIMTMNENDNKNYVFEIDCVTGKIRSRQKKLY